MSGEQLADLVRAAVRDAGGLRALSRAIDVCPGYLSRLQNGEKLNPSDEVLAALGIRREVSYHRA